VKERWQTLHAQNNRLSVEVDGLGAGRISPRISRLRRQGDSPLTWVGEGGRRKNGREETRHGLRGADWASLLPPWWEEWDGGGGRARRSPGAQQPGHGE